MLEKICDIWAEPADAKCIPTNGSIRKDGVGIMGAGVAKEAAALFPDLPARLGHNLSTYGNRTRLLMNDGGVAYIMLPTKWEWWDPSDIHLIEDSLHRLAYITSQRGWKKVLVPRPGCGNGGLTWDQVKPIAAKHLNDRFVVVFK